MAGKPGRRPVPLVERFWSKVQKSDGCWEWTANRTRFGHGLIWRDGTTDGAHRVSWEIANDQPVPPGMFVCHHCDNPPCVRPDHLFIGTPKDNTVDAARKGRMARGDRHSSRTHPERVVRGERAKQHKIPEADIPGIRAAVAAGADQLAIASKYGVTRQAIWNIANRKTWKHVA